jgi:hypothetical protein
MPLDVRLDDFLRRAPVVCRARHQEGFAMIERQVLQTYKRLPVEEKRVFERWIKANVVVGSVLAAALVTMGVAGSWFQESGSAQLANALAKDVIAGQRVGR